MKSFGEVVRLRGRTWGKRPCLHVRSPAKKRVDLKSLVRGRREGHQQMLDDICIRMVKAINAPTSSLGDFAATIIKAFPGAFEARRR
ncbi:hypothetical protein A6V36_30430 [Paraburkholderia ginsengiterrae]|uniref:Uncharacterized protein n=1 Tax=Paraburkholderia ginsengiterrae TaxID=1462993 RepID=A0A1A9N324_9BURK|nr:hypothetical protein A6V37_32190 [Paraburkholderia ginsengiterrae]OAJ58562.1 hypothetical protein A6V36_30430 [Paraburkholderia ginsengiterrae]